MYGVIASPEKEKALMELIGEQIVYSSFQKSDKPEHLKRILEMAARVPLNTLIVDVSTGQGLVDSIQAYCLQRPATRVILLAVGLVPGDSTVASIVQLGIYDIVETEDWSNRLQLVLEQNPADYLSAAKWNIQIDVNREKESLSKGLFERFVKVKSGVNHETKIMKEIENVCDLKPESAELLSSAPPDIISVPDDFLAIEGIPGIRNAKENGINKASEVVGDEKSSSRHVRVTEQIVKGIADIAQHNKQNIKFRAPQILSKLTLPTRDEVDNLIAVWSPASAGKTFTAVNLATAYVCRGYKVILASDDAFAHWLGMAKPISVLGGRCQGIIPRDIPGLTVLMHANVNDYRKLTEKDIVVVDGCRDTIQYASQVILVVNRLNLEQIAGFLDREDLDWGKTWVLANGVTEDDGVGDIESAIRLKVDYIVPFLPDSSNSVAILTKTELAEIFFNVVSTVND